MSQISSNNVRTGKFASEFLSTVCGLDADLDIQYTDAMCDIYRSDPSLAEFEFPVSGKQRRIRRDQEAMGWADQQDKNSHADTLYRAVTSEVSNEVGHAGNVNEI